MTATNKKNEPSTTSERTVLYATVTVKNEVEEQVKKIILEKLGLEETQLKPGASFTDDLGIDSLDVFELMIEIENIFQINIPSEEAEKLRSPGALIEYIKKQKT